MTAPAPAEHYLGRTRFAIPGCNWPRMVVSRSDQPCGAYFIVAPGAPQPASHPRHRPTKLVSQLDRTPRARAQDVDALMAAMETFLSDPSLSETMGEASRKMALERFRVEKVNDTFIQALEGNRK